MKKTITIALWLAVAALLVLWAGTAAAADPVAGKAVYDARCATCHGTTGKTDPESPVVLALGVVPADFSDPLFNSREPRRDWEMVIRHGGHAMGLAAAMPAHGEVLDDAEIGDVAAYVKTIVDTSEYPPGEMNLMLPVRTKKAFPEDEVVYAGRYTSQDGEDAWKNVLEFEKRVGKRGQWVAELIHEAEGSVSELAEVEVGYKHALSFSAGHILSGAAVVAIPVEADGDGEFQTYLAYGTRLSPQWTFQGSLRFKFPFAKSSDGEAELAGIVHWVHTPWPRRVFPALEVTATLPYRSANGDLAWTALPQVRIGLTRGGHVALNVGAELPLSDQSWDRRIYMTLLWDFADGSFFKGW